MCVLCTHIYHTYIYAITFSVAIHTDRSLVCLPSSGYSEEVTMDVGVSIPLPWGFYTLDSPCRGGTAGRASSEASTLLSTHPAPVCKAPFTSSPAHPHCGFELLSPTTAAVLLQLAICKSQLSVVCGGLAPSQIFQGPHVAWHFLPPVPQLLHPAACSLPGRSSSSTQSHRPFPCLLPVLSVASPEAHAEQLRLPPCLTHGLSVYGPFCTGCI